MNKQRGFTLVEIFISLAVGLALFAGVLSVFVGMKTTSQETATYGELQENGRFALSVLSDDLLKQNFWGDYTGTLDKSMLNAVPNSAPSDECIGEGLNNGTFPAGIGHFRALWGQTVTNSSIMGCIEDAKVASDVIQFKRAISEPLTLSTAQQYYIISNLSEASIFTGTTIPKVLNSQLWEYQHHIYYIREEVQGNNTVPVLMQGRLTKKMTFDPIIGIVDTFVSADNMTITQWDHGNDNRILAVRIYVLARSILPDSKYTNSNTYNLGDLPVTFNDNYRRLLFNSTVTLYNAGVDSW